MNAPTQLEDRLRRGLQAAADALPEASLAPSLPGGDGRPARRDDRANRPWMPLVAAVAVVAAATAAFVAVNQPDDSGNDSEVEVATPGEGAQAPHEVRPANGRVPGQAVVVEGADGTSDLNTYGPDGAPTGTVDLAPLEDVQVAGSDLQGGWVACGSIYGGPDTGEGTPRTDFTDQIMWFPAGSEPVVLETRPESFCIADSMQVVDAPEGPTVVYLAQPYDAGIALHAIVLATGEQREVPLRVEATNDSRWAASTGLVVATVDDGPLQLFDLVSGDSLPIAAIDVPRASDIVLSPDATSVALIVDPTGELEPAEVVVYDLATGAERFRETFQMNLEGAQLSYDGTTLAVGNWSDDYGGTTTVIDLASGARHTIDSHGLVL
jgi:hypothetical protein